MNVREKTLTHEKSQSKATGHFEEIESQAFELGLSLSSLD